MYENTAAFLQIKSNLCTKSTSMHATITHMFLLQVLLAELSFTLTPSCINTLVPLKVKMCCKQDQIIIVLILLFCLIENFFP